MLWMQSISAVLTLGTAYFVARDANLVWIFLVQAGIGSANALNAPAFQASMPLLVHRSDLPGAISLNSAMINGTRVMGPVAAAILAGVGLSVAWIFVINAITYLFFIAALVLVQMPDVKADTLVRGWRQLGVGINIARHRLVLNRLLIGMFSFSLISLIYVGLFPSVAELNFGIAAKSSTYRWLYATWGLGAFFGAISVGTFLSRFHRRVLIVRGFTGYGIALAVFSQLRDPVTPFFVGFVLGFFYFMTATAITTSLQLNMKDGERASVMPLWFMVFGGTVPIGNLIGGVLFEVIGAAGRARRRRGVGVVPRVVARPAPPTALGVPERSRRRRATRSDADDFVSFGGTGPPAPHEAVVRGRSERHPSMSSATIRSRPAARLAFTSTTSPSPR